MRKLFITVTLATMLAVTACGGSSQTSTQTAAETQAENVTEAVTEAVTEELGEPEEVIVNDYVWDAGSLAYLGLDRDEIWDIYNELMDMLVAEDYMDNGDEMEAYENECTEEIAEKYGITPDDVDQIVFASASPTYYLTFDPDDVQLRYVDLKSIVSNGKTIILNTKLEPLLTNNQTIQQNYFTVCYFIRDYLGDYDYDEIQYWGVGDMTSGSEGKVISFTVPKRIIQAIQSGDFIDNQLGDYVDDLWILPSLLN